LFECERADLCDASWIFEDDLSTEILHQELRRIDRGFEVIYDRHTALSSTHPGHHLYRIVSRGGSPMGDRLVLEFSLQEDITQPWPDGMPKAPGRWVVALVKSMDKANQLGNPAYLNRPGVSIEGQGLQARATAEEARIGRMEAGEAEKAAEMGRNVDKYAVRDVVSTSGGPGGSVGKKRRLTRRERRRIASSYQGQKKR
jgi:hypothetical protein